METVSNRDRNSAARNDRSGADGEYTVRWFRDGDTAAYLDLYEEAFDDHGDRDWFDWKFRDNPFVDHVPIFVAETGEELVGACSHFALPLRIDGETIPAQQPCDTMVDADHRRRGIFTQLTERAIDVYRAGEPRLWFNFPNDKTLAGNMKLGWRVVEPQTVWYRIQNPAAIARVVSDRRSIRVASRLAAPVASGYLASREHLDGLERAPGIVEHLSSVPVERLSALYHETDAPTGIHVPRTARFLEWRYRNPRWEYRTYVLQSDAGDVAAIVVGTRTVDGITKTKVMDFLADTSRRTEAAARLLPAVLSDHRDSDLVASLSDSVPPAALRRRGFLPDSRPPLDRFTSTTTLVTLSLSGDDAWDVNGVSIEDPASWALAFAEQDRN